MALRTCRTLPVRPVGSCGGRSRCCIVRQAAPAEGKPGASKVDGGDEEEFVGLLPEEDQEVPGTYFDALNRNTKLGKAVASAVDELEHLNDMVGRGGPRQTGSRGEGGREMESLAQADQLLQKLGLKGSLFGAAAAPPPPKSKKGKAGQGAAEDDDDLDLELLGEAEDA
ncbi:hypothetical protein MNEG_7439 [Monoraphidium neglectum]|uniref:Uncharacterized protein n=1 Tax=Monoraphidium neglectum TaxID=145388 RepID=A0A0D2MIP7_9CHLO|nr:hypothetical protein MNEG_7439 [Monoraphidium neglectum]KIZ00522.1 hypothetical protein MNEG_7439 [Monoraphidium neglectum]|eukprot:XP_013899541.1 hypothetical protein MNEG_7439 [Monoraphidium neglectum]